MKDYCLMSRRLSLMSYAIAALGFSLAVNLSTSAFAAADLSCDLIFNAIKKLIETPNHQFMSQSSATEALTHGGRIRSSESISTGDISYVKVNDQWIKVPFTPQDLLKQQEENRQKSEESCSFVKDDASEGDASIYRAHSETEHGKSDVEIWISKANGLPLREEIDLDTGTDQGATHSSVRFVYDHIEAPKDAKNMPGPGGH